MEELERLKQIAQESADKIYDSATFLAVCSDNYTKDPICLIQLSLGILMGKPLFLLIAKGTNISKNLDEHPELEQVIDEPPYEQQAVTKMPKSCTVYPCTREPQKAKLEKDGNGFMVCPLCKRYYGKP